MSSQSKIKIDPPTLDVEGRNSADDLAKFHTYKQKLLAYLRAVGLRDFIEWKIESPIPPTENKPSRLHLIQLQMLPDQTQFNNAIRIATQLIRFEK